MEGVVKMKKTEKMKKENEEIWFHTENPRRLPGFTVVVVTFFRQNPRRFPWFLFRNVSLSQGKSTIRFAGSPFFLRRVTIFIGRETKTHILPTKINEKKAKVSPFINAYSCNNNNTTTTTTTTKKIQRFHGPAQKNDFSHKNCQKKSKRN